MAGNAVQENILQMSEYLLSVFKRKFEKIPVLKRRLVMLMSEMNSDALRLGKLLSMMRMISMFSREITDIDNLMVQMYICTR